MHAAPELPLRMSPAHRASHRTLDERVLASRVRARRRWVIQTGLFLMATALLLVLLVVWRRDSLSIATLLYTYEAPAAALQGRLDELGTLPAAVPDPHGEIIASYAGDAERFYAAHIDDPVIIAISRPVRLKLREDGRAVILHEGGKLRIEWMPTSRIGEAMQAQLDAMRAFEQQRQPPQLP
jgi:hypothetical protein